MTDRILAWLSAGVLAAGLSAATIAGATIAAADDDAGANATTSSQSTASTDNETKSDADKPGANATTSSHSTASTDNETKSDADKPGANATTSSQSTASTDNETKPDADKPGANATTSSQSTASTDNETKPDADKPGARPDPVDGATDATVTEEDAEEEADEPADEEVADKPEEAAEEVEIAVNETESGRNHDGAIGADEPEATLNTFNSSAVADEVHDTAPAVTDKTQVTEVAGLSHTPDSAAEREPVLEARTAETVTTFDAQPSPAAARLVMAAAEEEKPAPTPSLLNVVGSFFWGLFDLATKLLDFPPVVSPGSTLTAGRSTLQIDCGDGYTADADWYFPTEGEPDKFIYFQHGFPARAGFYNLTLEALAERNNAIVVAPSITSNIFACDACAMSGEPMQAAVARLFEGDRAALLASAEAAGYEGTLPEQFVITGQSAGASLAVAAAGYYHQFAPANEKSNMVGVILYDVSAIGGSATGNALANALDKLPATLPVLNIASTPSTVNSQGSANGVFTEKRPGQFNGVQLVGGAHSDAFQSDVLFGIPQFLTSLLFGFSAPKNVEAVQVLTAGWLTDMYAGRVYDPATRTGIYGEPGDPGEVVVDIPTDAGLARGYVLPARTPALSPIDHLIDALFGLINANLYATCAVDPDESASAQRGDLG